MNPKYIIEEKGKKNNHANNSSLLQKRLRHKHIFVTTKNNANPTIIINSNDNSSISLNEHNINFPEFQINSLTNESIIIKKVEQENHIWNAISNYDKKYKLI